MKFKDFHINIKIRMLTDFVSGFLGSMVFPFMTIYLVKHYDAKVAGGLLLINVVIGIIISFFGGYLADQYGRKRILLFSETLRVFAFVIMALSNSPWFESASITFLMMTVNTVCWGLSGPANSAMLIDISKPAQRKLIYTISYWGDNLAIAVGGIFGAFLFKDYLFELFVSLSFATMLIVLIIFFFIQESYLPEKADKSVSHVFKLLKTYREVFRDRLFILFVLAGILLLSIELQLSNYIAVRLSEDISVQQVLFWEIDGVRMLGILRTENTILVVLLSFLILRLSKKIKDQYLLFSGALLFTIGYSMISYVSHLWALLFFMMIATIGEVIRVPVEQSYIAAMPPKHARSSYMAVSGLTFHLAMLISTLTLILSEFVPPMMISMIIALTGCIAILIFAMIFNKLQDRMRKNGVAVD